MSLFFFDEKSNAPWCPSLDRGNRFVDAMRKLEAHLGCSSGLLRDENGGEIYMSRAHMDEFASMLSTPAASEKLTALAPTDRQPIATWLALYSVMGGNLPEIAELESERALALTIEAREMDSRPREP